MQTTDPTEKPDVTVLIPTYNKFDLLKECLDSLYQQTYLAFEIIVVDDGSTEDIENKTSDLFPDVKVLQLSMNRGFATAVNVGLDEITTSYAFLLNNDMTLDPGCLELLMNATKESDHSMIAPLVFFKDDPDIVYSAGDKLRKNGRPESIGYREPKNQLVIPETIFGVSGGAALINMDVIKTVGPLDERFIAYFEDVDLCFRAQLAGFSATCVPEAHAYHVGSASQDGQTWYRSRQCYRNHGLLLLKCMPITLMLKYSPRILKEHIHQTSMILSSARCEFGLIRALFIMLRADLSLMRNIPHALIERFRKRKYTKVNTRTIDKLLEP
jgi:hypothetical protein